MLHPAARAALIAALVNVDATAEEQGWDLPPVLFAVFHQPSSATDGRILIDDTLLRYSGVHVADPAHPGQNLPPGIALHHLVAELSNPAGRQWLQDWLHRDGWACVGFGLLFEAWKAPYRPGYRRGDLAKTPAADRVEVRVITMSDTDGLVYRVTRERDATEPAITTDHLTPDLLRGTVITGLQGLLALARAAQ